MTSDIILAILLSLPSHRTDAGLSIVQRTAMLQPVAEAIAEATDDHDVAMAAGLIALGQHETHYASYVLEGRCTDGPKDPGSNGRRRAWRAVSTRPQALRLDVSRLGVLWGSCGQRRPAARGAIPRDDGLAPSVGTGEVSAAPGKRRLDESEQGRTLNGACAPW